MKYLVAHLDQLHRSIYEDKVGKYDFQSKWLNNLFKIIKFHTFYARIDLMQTYVSVKICIQLIKVCNKKITGDSIIFLVVVTLIYQSVKKMYF